MGLAIPPATTLADDDFVSAQRILRLLSLLTLAGPAPTALA